MTRDVDLTLLAGFGEEQSFAEGLLARFESRVADPVGFAERNRVVLLRTSGIPVDIALGALPFEERAVEPAGGRASMTFSRKACARAYPEPGFCAHASPVRKASL